MDVLGIDFGTVRIGVATGDTKLKLANPYRIIQTTGTLKKDGDAITKLANELKVEKIVVGVPILEEANDGGKMQKICFRFGAILSENGFEVSFVNEAMTSIAVEDRLIEAHVRAAKRKDLRDSVAAAIILESYFRGDIILNEEKTSP